MTSTEKEVFAVKHLRRVRGGALGSLVKCSDDHIYVIKSPGNPQGTRTLVNDLLASIILQALDIETPRTRGIQVRQEFLDQYPEFDPAPKNSRRELLGCHFGSRVPGNASSHAIHDFWPDVLVPQLSNSASFTGALVVDQWLANTDRPQAIFIHGEHLTPSRNAMTALHIDRGMTCGGSSWKLHDSVLHGVNGIRGAFFDHVKTWEDLRVWTSAVEGFSESLLRSLSCSIPPEWIDSVRDYERLIDQIALRRLRATYRMEDLIRSQANPFSRLNLRVAVAADWT